MWFTVIGYMECYTCRSISGERRISPGPTIFEGEFWLVEHAYPCRMVGWLVLVLKRHVEALHELSGEEFAELGELQGRVARLLHGEMGCEKEYMACFAEAEHFRHVHVHMVAKDKGLPPELKGTAIFAMLKATDEEAVPPDEIKAFCEEMKASFEF